MPSERDAGRKEGAVHLATEERVDIPCVPPGEGVLLSPGRRFFGVSSHESPMKVPVGEREVINKATAMGRVVEIFSPQSRKSAIPTMKPPPRREVVNEYVNSPVNIQYPNNNPLIESTDEGIDRIKTQICSKYTWQLKLITHI